MEIPLDPGLFDAAVNGIPLIALVFSLVAYLKQTGITGKALLYASLIIGAVLGFGYMLYAEGVPATFAGWFGYVIYGLGLGLLTSKTYDGFAAAQQRSFEKSIVKLEEEAVMGAEE